MKRRGHHLERKSKSDTGKGSEEVWKPLSRKVGQRSGVSCPIEESTNGFVSNVKSNVGEKIEV